jgi:AraC-like DNA-binding protein
LTNIDIIIVVKVLPFKIPKPENVSLYVQVDRGRNFYDKLHQHEEIQISLIAEGEGTYIIGDGVGAFKKNDLFVIGEHIPHVFKSDVGDRLETVMISLFFTRYAYGEGFFDRHEFEHLSPFFDLLPLGYEVVTGKDHLEPVLRSMPGLSIYDQFTGFLDLLKTISEAEKRPLSSLINLKKYNENEGKRMSDIFQFTMNNFSREVSLTEIAGIANMTPNAFCRYFKQRTNKTFVNFLIDIRIGHACKLLDRNKELSIMEIAYQSGFNNLANFNRKFKAIKKMTPSAYRRKH